MKQKDLTKTFMTISDCTKTFCLLIYTKIIQRFEGYLILYAFNAGKIVFFPHPVNYILIDQIHRLTGGVDWSLIIRILNCGQLI